MVARRSVVARACVPGWMPTGCCRHGCSPNARQTPQLTKSSLDICRLRPARADLPTPSKIKETTPWQKTALRAGGFARECGVLEVRDAWHKLARCSIEALARYCITGRRMRRVACTRGELSVQAGQWFRTATDLTMRSCSCRWLMLTARTHLLSRAAACLPQR